MQKMLVRQGIESVCIPNATEVPHAVPLDCKSSTILYAGRLEKLKGVQNLILALPLIRAHVPHAQLVIAGAGTYEPELRRLASDLSLEEHIIWRGHVDSATLHSLYAMSAVVAVPSIWPEPFGKVGIEAMGVGRAVVASNVGGISEWLTDSVTGYLVPPNDSTLLANALVRILTDTPLRVRMGDAGKAHAKKFHIEHFCKSLLDLHRRCVSCKCGVCQ
jgi:glycosyltransferase involved in cell wall biosynthesis